MEAKDYVASISDQIRDLDYAQQTSFGMAAVILFDTAWFKAVHEIIEPAKAYEITTRTWNIVGERTTQLMKQTLGFDRITTFDQLRAIIKAGYRAWLIPIRIQLEDADRFEYECLACPFPAYGIGLFGVEQGDYLCRVWKAMTPAWIDGIVKEAGLDNQYKAEIDSAICCGDASCKVTVKRVKE